MNNQIKLNDIEIHYGVKLHKQIDKLNNLIKERDGIIATFQCSVKELQDLISKQQEIIESLNGQL